MSSCTSVAVWMISTTAPSRTAPRPSYWNSLEERKRSAGRMRLPPPARRYSPISVMACTLETVSCSNSPSRAARSSRSRSKISFPLIMAGALNDGALLFASSAAVLSVLRLVRPVIGKLQVDSEIMLPQHSDDFLQRVAVLAADTHQISLDRSLCFLLRILNQLHDLPRLFDGDALLHGDAALGGSSRRRFHRAVGQPLQRDPALDQLLLEDIVHRLQFVFVSRVQHDRVFLQFDVRL